MNDVIRIFNASRRWLAACPPLGAFSISLLAALGLVASDAMSAEPSLAELIQAEADGNGIDVHEQFFSQQDYAGTGTCLLCHQEAGEQMLDSAHFKWIGKVENIEGLKGEQAGKLSLLNNFCIATASNEGRCTQCHTGYGWKDDSFDFNNPENVDCLVCHDQTGQYKKAPTTAGLPDPSVDLQAVASAMRVGAKPTRAACIGCHAFAGGGDNVKHGDISSDLYVTTKDFDVHMGTNGGDMLCVDCHSSNHDPKTGKVNHGMAGMPLHSVHEGELRSCTDCHGNQKAIHRGTMAGSVLFFDDWHNRLACQTCHIPAIARKISTKTEWYWSEAGQNVSPLPIDRATGRATYDKKKGTFKWENNVRPQFRWFNGSWERMVLNVSDTYDEVPIPLATPQGDRQDPKAMIYPFKMMVGNQPVDPVNQRVMVPHLFGGAGGPNPYWSKFDWNLAIEDGAAVTGQPFSGEVDFVDTTMFLTVNHEVAPAAAALGQGGLFSGCMDCHGLPDNTVDWQALGWTDDPLFGGEIAEQ
ncbi:MAG: tetrathionate reductase family octaheme c-type cytochrome [Wenzhouxiangellaceae bacterium]|nr:tetrathionate reductase family octaheme c-type cytochrome [Wenzhouxiangellaceae bacterium]